MLCADVRRSAAGAVLVGQPLCRQRIDSCGRRLQDAVTDGLLAENVARNLRLVFPYRPRFQPWSAAEARLFLRAAR